MLAKRGVRVRKRWRLGHRPGDMPVHIALFSGVATLSPAAAWRLSAVSFTVVDIALSPSCTVVCGGVGAHKGRQRGGAWLWDGKSRRGTVSMSSLSSGQGLSRGGELAGES